MNSLTYEDMDGRHRHTDIMMNREVNEQTDRKANRQIKKARQIAQLILCWDPSKIWIKVGRF